MHHMLENKSGPETYKVRDLRLSSSASNLEHLFAWELQRRAMSCSFFQKHAFGICLSKLCLITCRTMG
jgi:hypothetical protein